MRHALRDVRQVDLHEGRESLQAVGFQPRLLPPPSDCHRVGRSFYQRLFAAPASSISMGARGVNCWGKVVNPNNMEESAYAYLRPHR